MKFHKGAKGFLGILREVFSGKGHYEKVTLQNL